MEEKFMQLALELAAQAKGRTSPNPMVGAVVVKDGVIVGQGYHQKAGTPHAEVHALREAGQLAKGATVYVTLEPCSHFGRTPPCTQALIQAGVSRVVAAMVDPNPLVAGQGLAQLQAAGIETEVGLLEAEAKKLNEVFIKFITTRLPFVVFKTAMTLDGKIATEQGQSQWVTGSVARQFVHQLRDTYDAIMVGIGTVLADDPALTTRLPGNAGRDPIRVIVDSQARIPLEAKVLKLASSAKTIIAVGPQAPSAKLAALTACGAQVLMIPEVEEQGKLELPSLLAKLSAEGICSVLLEGGGQLAGSFFRSGLVDKVYWFVAPKIIGGQRAPGPVGNLGKSTMDEAINLTAMQTQYLGEDLLIEGYPRFKDNG